MRAHQHDLRLFEPEVDKDAPECFFVFFNAVVELAEMALMQEAQLWIRHWRGVASGVGCQFRIVGSVYSSLGTQINSLRTLHKSGLWH